MAKNKVEIDVIVDDKGTTKKVGLDAKKAGDGLDKVGKSAHTADRNLKGAAQASSNTTKNFSKMAQGTGGLVAAYATLAANVFAISAAFQFLKSAGDLKVLEEGQGIYAKNTGIAIRTLTSDIMAATDAQIGFQEASQAAAIGLAAGLSSSQLVKLGKAAKDTSIVLGRDVTDSFNRLVRGATKAEPELLDELGIILRLETATENYARTLGKTAKDLTAFERSQAVTNDILTQAEEKYGKMLEGQDGISNSVNKLGKAFENDLIKPLKIAIAAVASPVFNFLADNVAALALAFGALALPIVKAIIPGLQDMGAAARERADEAREHAAEAKQQAEARINQLKRERAELLNTRNAARASAQAAVKDLKAKKGSGLAVLQAGGTPSERQSAGMIRAIEGSKGEYSKLTQAMRDDLVAKLKQMQSANEKTVGFFKRSWTGATVFFKSKVSQMRSTWAAGMAFMRGAAAKMVSGVNKAMRGLAIIGMIIMIIDLAKAGFNALMNLFRSDEQKEAIAEQERFAEKLEASRDRAAELADELKKIRQGQLESSIVGATEVTKAGLTAGSVDKEDLLMRITSGDLESYKSARNELRLIQTIMKDVKSTSLKADFAAFDFSDKGITKMGREGIKDFLALLSKIQEQGAAADSFTKSLKNQAKEITGVVNAYLPSSKFDSALENIGAIKKALEETELGGRERIKLNREERKHYEKILAQEKVLTQMRLKDIKHKQNKLKLDTLAIKHGDAITKLQKRQLDMEVKILQTRESIRDKEVEIANFKNAIALRDGIMTDFERENLDLMTLQLEKMLEQEQVQLRQLNNVEQLKDAFKAGFENQMVRSVADLIKGNESSLKDAMRAIANAALSSVADKLAEQLTKPISDFLFGKPPELLATEENTKALRENTAALKGDGTSGLISDPDGEGTTASPFKTLGQKISGGFTKATDYLFGKKTTAVQLATGEGTAGMGTANVETIFRKGGVFTDFTNSLKDLFSGDAPFLESLGNVFKDGASGFGQLFGDIFGGLFGGGSGGGSFFTDVMGFFGFKTGGIMDQGKKIAGYSTGGIAKGSKQGYPAVLHGTEAVVPLPNGKSIPVEMNNAGNMQNNIVVNVTNEGGTQTESNDGGPDSERLGKVIAQAVQAEMQNQKRAGGILNPYGAA